jgi:probable HAF family extracellular repeat protein
MKREISGQRLLMFLAVVMPLMSAVSAAQSPTFSVQALPNPGGTRSSVAAINNAGEAVGSVGGGSSVCPAGCLVVWIDGTPTPLGSVPGATGADAYGINNAGQVVGTELMAGNQLAVIWNNGTPTLLPSPAPQYTQTFATSINDAGQVVGQAADQAGSSNEVLVATEWNGLTPTVLGLLAQCTDPDAFGINNNGLVVGAIYCADQAVAVVWHGTTATLLPGLKPGAGIHGVAHAVNNLGVVVGVAATSSGTVAAAAWANGAVTNLGTLTGYRSSAAAINSRGIIVGESATVDYSVPHAVIWSRIGAAPEDLNSLISNTAAAEIVLTGATGINESCAIVANGYNVSTRAATAYLLTMIDASNCVNGL